MVVEITFQNDQLWYYQLIFSWFFRKLYLCITSFESLCVWLSKVWYFVCSSATPLECKKFLLWICFVKTDTAIHYIEVFLTISCGLTSFWASLNAHPPTWIIWVGTFSFSFIQASANSILSLTVKDNMPSPVVPLT